MGTIDLDSQKPFAGRYRVLRRIAAGGMGAVFEVEHIQTQRRRALKVMLPELVSNRELRARFEMEARVTARVDSEYLVDVFDAGVDDSTAMPFLVMELLQGEELGQALIRVGPVPPELGLLYLRQVASALDKTHQAGIVHRDLKPENLFLTHREDGTPCIKILDFGISKVVNEATTGANTTRSLGTPLYMAPEQVLGQSVSPATDLYSLGLIAYTLLVGASYWQVDADKFDNAIAFVLHTTRGTTESAVARAALLGRVLPAEFDAWFRRATHLQAALRFQRASELVNELGRLLGFAPEAAEGAPNSPQRAPHLRSEAQAVSGRIAGGTGPGTEFDRPGTIPGVPRKGAWLIVAAIAAVAAIASAAVFTIWRPPSALASAVAPQVSAPAMLQRPPAPTPAAGPASSATAETVATPLASSNAGIGGGQAVAAPIAKLGALASKASPKAKASASQAQIEVPPSPSRRAPQRTPEPIYTRD